MKTINYLTLIFSFVSMVIVFIILFRPETANKKTVESETKQKSSLEVKEMSYVKAQISGEIPESDAENMTRVFRDNNPPEQTKIIIHDPAALIKYLNNNFLFYTKKVPPPAGFEWKLAMAPMYFAQGTTNKLTMSFLPTLVESTAPANVKEFWTCKYSTDAQERQYYITYFKPLMDIVKAAGFKSFVFDEGQLWP